MRNFGIEIELNSFDQRDFKNNYLQKGERPLGIEYIFNYFLNIGLDVKLDDWHNNHNNKEWICKPDSSCGIEICSPVLENFQQVEKVISFLSNDECIKIDNRCSFHVHVNVEDLEQDDILSVLCWWIKFDHLFLDAMPDCRKMNKYCQCIGMTDIFNHDDIINKEIINKLGQSKYLSCNTFHLCRGSRNTIEFRIADADACLNIDYAKNWVLLLIHFVETFKNEKIPDSLVWENPKKLFNFLFKNENARDIRSWFLNKIKKNANSNILNWDHDFRKFSIFEFLEILNNLQLDKDYFCNSNLMNK
jgi:hypothetical protein